ncbi:MAG TPA: chromosome segregation protein SMC [Candidatus Limnocylindrales bacterium]
MTAPARLLALSLHGFKSFAGRTQIEFGPGISAIVGPNGSGKSNLADALRWTLGEQGRSLRTRRAEDVIWAGSDRRSALGMADVTLVLDNADGLLSTDYGTIEIGRRLYRSGENDYLLNRQRIRLRDLVDLLDSAHLADNAFLFIGQGMVDQALALRPEERRPLFEEVAGVRRHERRRRKAEEQLLESTANLVRMDDILAELRPQARRLAAQAEQQSSRLTAGEELADGLLVAAHGRWHVAAERLAEAASARDRARAESARAMAELADAESAAAAISAELAARAGAEADRRGEYDAARNALTALQLREERLAADHESLARDRARLADDRAAAESDLTRQRRLLSAPPPELDRDLAAGLAAAERDLADALAEIAGAEAASRGFRDDDAALRRASEARRAEAETVRGKLADAERRRDVEVDLAATIGARRADQEHHAATVRSDLAAAIAAEAAAASALEAARLRSEATDARGAAAAEGAAAKRAALATVRSRLDALQTRLAEEESQGISRAARRLGGRRVDASITVDPALRGAVERALSDAARAYVVRRDTVERLSAERGVVVVEEATIPRGRESAAGETRAATGQAAERRIRERIAETGGGLLADGVGGDPGGIVRSLLSRTGWVPTLEAGLALQAELPAGWTLVLRDGSALVTGLTVHMGRVEGLLEWRATATRLTADAARLAGELVDLEATARTAAEEGETARAARDAARAREARAAAARRGVEDADRAAVRELEATVRELEWRTGQAARLGEEVTRLRVGLQSLQSNAGVGRPAGARLDEAESEPRQPSGGDEATAGGPERSASSGAALATWLNRAEELRARRDRLAAAAAIADAARRDAETQRARAEAAAAIDEAHLTGLDAETARLDERERGIEAARQALRSQLASAVEREAAARAAVDELLEADAVDRGRLAEAEHRAATVRAAGRTADDGARRAERDDLEARLGLDSLREQVLVELAGLGEVGRRRLEGLVAATARAAGQPEAAGAARDLFHSGDPDVEDAVALEAALDAISSTWAAEQPPQGPPSAARLGALRRRFHELGAPNPYAVDEYGAIKARLDALEAQSADLRHGIDQTRHLIEELSAMIADQFRSTFRALEAAFEERFEQLFGGGFARLSLTDPADLGSTGIEIIARPPGKKAQPLAMLSGGERALTAVALLFAMLQVRPVPFCVLDEVDAALDEANVTRFTDALRELAARTQFVVITHNRGTIETADALYGVTVGDDSVSRVVSLRLEEAREIADQRRAEHLASASA